MTKPRNALLILVPVVLLGVIFYVSTRETHISEEEMSYLLPEGSLNEKGEVKEGPDNHEADQESTGMRIAAINYVVGNISSLSQKEPVFGGGWYVTRFWFVDDENFYVEYEDGHIMEKLLISDLGESYTVVGYFEPGENDWELIEGEDPYFGRNFDLYEYSKRAGEWTKRN